MKIGILHTAFFGDLVNLGLLLDYLASQNHQIFLFTNNRGRLIFESDMRVTGVILVAKKTGIQKIMSIFDIARSIQSTELDVLMVPHRSATSAIIARISKVPLTIGFHSAALSFLYDRLLPYSTSRHECLRILDLGSALPAKSLPEFDADFQRLEALAIPILKSANVLKSFQNKFPDFDAPNMSFFVVSPGSVWPTKIYPVEKLAAVIVSLLKMNPVSYCIVSGGPEDQKSISDLFLALENFPSDVLQRCLNAFDCLPIPELVTLLRYAKFSIANDSGPFHFALAVGTPVVGIYGPTPSDTGFGPTGNRSVAVSYVTQGGKSLPCYPCGKHGARVCPLRHHQCMTLLEPLVVVDAVRRLVPSW